MLPPACGLATNAAEIGAPIACGLYHFLVHDLTRSSLAMLAAEFAAAPIDIKRAVLAAVRMQHEAHLKFLANLEEMMPPPSPLPRVAPSPPPKRGVVFYATEPKSLPNAIEVELLSTLFVAVNGADLANQLRVAVEAEADRIRVQGVAWTPPTIGALNPSSDLRLKNHRYRSYFIWGYRLAATRIDHSTPQDARATFCFGTPC